MSKATRLLSKAQSTDSDHEAIALAMRAYTLLAEAINDYTMLYGSLPAVRKHERRRLVDRRSNRRPDAGPAGAASGADRKAVVDGYARLAGDNCDHSIDLSL